MPIICGSEHLKALYISDQTKKTHDYEIVGWLTTTVVLDSGLDSDHEKYAKTQTARHEFEQYDVIVRHLPCFPRCPPARLTKVFACRKTGGSSGSRRVECSRER